MASATKIERYPDEQFIEDTLRSGRCTKQELSMKVLRDPDTAYQAREQHLDVNHVRMLEGIARDNDGKLGPVVVFKAAIDRKNVRYILADGFHRHAALTNMRATSIWAYVVECELSEIEHEARLFAAMCNRRLCLPRKPGDIKKAAEMLFADPICWRWSDSTIASHCGVSSTSIMKYRCNFSKTNEIDLPQTVFEKGGRERTYREIGPKYPIRKRKDRKSDEFRATVGKKTFYLGRNLDEAELKLSSIVNDLKKKKITLRDDVSVTLYLNKYGIVLDPLIGRMGSRFPGLRGSCGKDFIVTCNIFDSKDSVPWVVGCLQMLRIIAEMPTARMICVCYPEDGPSASIELAKQLGIEFLTPDELVDSIKNAEPRPETSTN